MLERSRRKHHDKVDAEPLPVDRAQICDRGGYFAAEQVDSQRVTDFKAHAAGQRGIERDERRALIIGRPPSAGREARALRHTRGISETTVAAQHPLRFRRDRRLFHGYPVQPSDAAAHHRHLIEPRAGGGAHQRIKASELIGLDVDEEKRRRLGRHFGLDLMRKIGLDERDGDQHGKPDPEREDDLCGRGSRPMQIGQREAQHRPARPADSSGDPEDRCSRPLEQCKGGNRPGHEPQRDSPVVRGNDRQRCEPERQGGGRRDYAGRDPAPRPIDGVAEQRAGGNPANSGERPEREEQRRQKSEQRRQSQRRRMDRKTKGDREHPGQQRRGGDRRQRT